MRNLLFLCSLMTAVTVAGCSSSSDGGGSGGAGGGGGSAGSSGGGGGAGGASCDTDYARISADTTATSFANDVLPIFQVSCTQSQCHCSRSLPTGAGLANCTPVSKGQLYLGVPGKPDVITTDVVTAVYDNLVGTASATSPATMRIAAGDPANSFLIQKISGTQNDVGHTDCVATEANVTQPCGDQMPNVGPSLCESGSDGQDRFETVARWVAQGAQNN